MPRFMAIYLTVARPGLSTYEMTGSFIQLATGLRSIKRATMRLALLCWMLLVDTFIRNAYKGWIPATRLTTPNVIKSNG